MAEAITVAACARCRRVASQGSVDRTPVCVSCALVGEPLDENSAGTNEIVTALVGPDRRDLLPTARGRLLAELRASNQPDAVAAYNRTAAPLVDALRRTPGSTLVHATAPLGLRRVNAASLTNGALLLAAALRQGEVSYDAAAAAMLAPVAAALGMNYRARGLLAAALGPFSAAEGWGAPRLLYLGDEPQQVLALDMEHVAAALRRTDDDVALERCTLQEAIEDTAAQLYSEEGTEMRRRLAAALPAVQHQLETTAHDEQQQQFDPAQVNVDLGALEALTARLAHDPQLRVDRLLGDAPPATMQAVRCYLQALPLSADSTLDDLALLRNTNTQAPLGADAVANVDASLLNRARDRASKAVGGKYYSLDKMRTQLLRVFARQLVSRQSDEELRTEAANAVAAAVKPQRAVQGYPTQWADFVVVGGTQFYRDPTSLPLPLPRATVTQDAFVKRYFGGLEADRLALELADMSDYMSRSSGRAQMRPTAYDELTRPGGLQGVPDTPEVREVARDLQRLRRQTVQELQRVEQTASARGQPPSGPGMVDAAQKVDELLLRIFAALWQQTTDASARASGRISTFEDIYRQEMSRRAGSAPASQRRSLVQRFLRR